MTVTVNQKTYELPEFTTLSALLSLLNIDPLGKATALNGVVISANQRTETVLHDGDSVIIIKAFYGG